MVFDVVLLVHKDAAVLVLNDVLTGELAVTRSILTHLVVLFQPFHSRPVISISSVNHIIRSKANDSVHLSSTLAPQKEQARISPALLISQFQQDPGDVLVPGIWSISETIAGF